MSGLSEQERETEDLAREIRSANLPILSGWTLPYVRTLAAGLLPILAARTEQARPWAGCTGASDCPESWHEHGCYADDGQCSDPKDHHGTEQARPEHVVKAEALREAADENDVLRHVAVVGRDVSQWLRDRADALEAGERP